MISLNFLQTNDQDVHNLLEIGLNDVERSLSALFDKVNFLICDVRPDFDSLLLYTLLNVISH